jgi:hypothetical protein
MRRASANRQKIRPRVLAEEVAGTVNVCGKVKRVLARQTLCQFRVTALQGFGDLKMIDD